MLLTRASYEVLCTSSQVGGLSVELIQAISQLPFSSFQGVVVA